jgi:hypothetical protein
MVLMDSPDGSGGSSATLQSVGTSSFDVYHEDDDRVSRRSEHDPQLQADVMNESMMTQRLTIQFYFGETQIREDDKQIDPLTSDTIAARAEWSYISSLVPDVPGDYELKARLVEADEWMTYGTMHIHESPDGVAGEVEGTESGDNDLLPDTDTDNDGTTAPEPDEGECPEGYYYDSSFGMCLEGDSETVRNGPSEGTNGDTNGDPTNADPLAGIPTLPALGPLTAEQTTAAAAALGVVLLVVMI